MGYLYEIYRNLKKDKGYILIEMITALGLFGILLLVLWTSYLSVYKSYQNGIQKAQSLEKARLVVTFITDSFQRYEAGQCEVVQAEDGRVTRIIFQDKDGWNRQVIRYNKADQKITFQGQEIAKGVSDFRASCKGDFYGFIIEVETITVGTRVDLKYMDPLQ